MAKIYFDESGNTGADLLNEDQKVFVLSSNIFSDSECQELKGLFQNPNELHFIKLKNSQKGRESIINLLNHKLISEEKVSLYIAHKEVATVAQIVDQLIEPVSYNRKIDIYKYGLNIQFTNLIFHFGNAFWNKELYENLLKNFIKMFRVKDNDSKREFYKTANELYESVEDEYKKLLLPIIDSEIIIDDILKNTDKFTIDLTLSCFMVLCDNWYKKIKMKFDAIFDNSKQMEHYKHYVEFLKNMNVPLQEIGYGSRKMTFPAQINEFRLTDSLNEINIQIADILASAITFMYNNKNPKYENFVNQIKNSKLINLNNTNVIWHTSKISVKDLKMEDASGENILDFLANYAIKNNK
ncbi:DUF3800 domain-containing protein [Chryseobacterium gambrini]|uniref:DUF3800 domain-containing protein n=1 Tax=Chryseobacterium gambrini TaxID=373672 RepID=UPI003D0A2130